MSISFDIGEELQAIVDAVHGFAEEQVRPALREFEAQRGLPDELRQACHELGLTTLVLPESLGGLDVLDTRAAALCSEELAWGDVGASVALPGPRSAGFLVLRLGSAEQQERLLRPFADEAEGWKRRGAIALVEGPFGLDPSAIEATARRDGDGWVLDGKKSYVQAAGSADLTLVLARDAGSQAADPWDRLAVFAVEGRPAGLTAGERDKLLGLDAAEFGALELKGLRVPAANRLGTGAPGEVRDALRRLVAWKKTLDAARLVGCARAASEYAFQYAQERQTFGNYLYEHQALAFMMADMATLVDAMRALVWRAAASIDAGGDGAADALLAYRYVSEQAVEVCSDAVQVLGGHGYLWDHPVEKWMRDARCLGLVDGLEFDDAAELVGAGQG